MPYLHKTLINYLYNNNLTYFLPIIISFLLICIPIQGIQQQLKNKNNDQQNEYLSGISIADRLYKPRQDEMSYGNLFQKYKDITIQTKLLIKPTSSPATTIKKGKSSSLQPVVLKQRKTSIILQKDFLNMYKSKLSFKFPLQITQRFLDEIQNVYIQNSFYVAINGNYHMLQTQSLPVTKTFKHLSRQGIQLLLLADTQLFPFQEQKQKLIQKVQIYLFQMQQQLIFSKLQKQAHSQMFKLWKQPNQSEKRYYYPKPLSENINTRLEQNYIQLSSVSVGSTHWLKFNIKIVPSDLFPLMYYGAERMYNISQDLQMRLQVIQDSSSLQKYKQIIQPILTRYIKNLFLNGSTLTWVFFISQCLISSFIVISSFMQLYYELSIYKNAQKYKGMSKYMLLTYLICDVSRIVAVFLTGSFYLQQQTLTLMFTVLFTVWKLNKIMRIQFRNFPNIQFEQKQWYMRYSNKDRQALKSAILFIVVFGLVVISYPIIWQGYFQVREQLLYRQDQSALEYIIIGRMLQVLSQYRFVFAILPQILLNYKLKSCNFISWKLLLWMIPGFSLYNFMIMGTNSHWEWVFYLKEELFLAVLIGQKLKYGNSLQNLLPRPQEQDQQQNHGQNQNKNDKTQTETQQHIKSQSKQHLLKVQQQPTKQTPHQIKQQEEQLQTSNLTSKRFIQQKQKHQ